MLVRRRLLSGAVPCASFFIYKRFTSNLLVTHSPWSEHNNANSKHCMMALGVFCRNNSLDSHNNSMRHYCYCPHFREELIQVK